MLQNQCYNDEYDSTLKCINWSKVTNCQIECFNAYVESDCELGGLAERTLSNSDLGDAYHMLTKTLKDYAQKHFPKKIFAKLLKPYWNVELSNYHTIMN